MTPASRTGAWSGLALRTGQEPMIHRSTTSVALWRLREGDVTGVSVTLRGRHALDFLDGVLHVVLPQFRPFHGYSTSRRDQHGNCTFPRKSPRVFPILRPHYERFRPRANRPGLSMTLDTHSSRAGGSVSRIRQRGQALLTGLGRPLIS
jgi:ribosomal protein L5